MPDAAGIAEVAAGAGRGVKGLVMLLTFGTGIGSARCFWNGKLVPNTELGHMEFHGVDAEHIASAHVRTLEHLDWPSWCARVNDLLARLHALFWPDLFIIGGSISEDFDQYGHLLHSPTEIRRAHYGAQAGAGFGAAPGGRRRAFLVLRLERKCASPRSKLPPQVGTTIFTVMSRQGRIPS